MCWWLNSRPCLPSKHFTITLGSLSRTFSYFSCMEPIYGPIHLAIKRKREKSLSSLQFTHFWNKYSLSSQIINQSHTWWPRFVIPEFRKLNEDHLIFKVRQYYIIIPCLKNNEMEVSPATSRRHSLKDHSTSFPTCSLPLSFTADTLLWHLLPWAPFPRSTQILVSHPTFLPPVDPLGHPLLAYPHAYVSFPGNTWKNHGFSGHMWQPIAPHSPKSQKRKLNRVLSQKR